MYQIAYTALGNMVYERSNNTSNPTNWNNWYRCDNFGCNTPAELASLLGANIQRNPETGKIADLNAQQPGCFCYANSNETQNMPSGATSADNIFYCFGSQTQQTALQVGGRDGNVFIRIKVYDNWGAWMKL